METVQRVYELLEERHMSLYRLAKVSGISYSSLKNTVQRNGQLRVDTIEQICSGLGIPLYKFFLEREDRS